MTVRDNAHPQGFHTILRLLLHLYTPKSILTYCPISNMTRILLIGATGYVGSALASELLRSGSHTVYGLARSEAKATQLAAKEIIPVIGSVTDSKAYISLIKTAQIHIVVDCAGANDGSAQILKDLIEAGKQRLKAGGAKLGFVYCSGMWVHGSSFEQISDLDPVGTVHAKAQPPGLVA